MYVILYGLMATYYNYGTMLIFNTNTFVHFAYIWTNPQKNFLMPPYTRA